MCRSHQEPEAALGEIQQWVSSVGLQLHPTKTRITMLEEGFECWGFRFLRSIRCLMTCPFTPSVNRPRPSCDWCDSWAKENAGVPTNNTNENPALMLNVEIGTAEQYLWAKAYYPISAVLLRSEVSNLSLCFFSTVSVRQLKLEPVPKVGIFGKWRFMTDSSGRIIRDKRRRMC